VMANALNGWSHPGSRPISRASAHRLTISTPSHFRKTRRPLMNSVWEPLPSEKIDEYVWRPRLHKGTLKSTTPIPKGFGRMTQSRSQPHLMPMVRNEDGSTNSDAYDPVMHCPNVPPFLRFPTYKPRLAPPDLGSLGRRDLQLGARQTNLNNLHMMAGQRQTMDTYRPASHWDKVSPEERTHHERHIKPHSELPQALPSSAHNGYGYEIQHFKQSGFAPSQNRHPVHS